MFETKKDVAFQARIRRKLLLKEKKYAESKNLQCPQSSSRIRPHISSSNIEDEHSLDNIIIDGTVRNKNML